jgi:integrase
MWVFQKEERSGTLLRLALNEASMWSAPCRVGASRQGKAKNLARVKSHIQRQAAGATKSNKEEIKGKIVEFLWYLKKQGYALGTIRTRIHLLQRLVVLGADILDPESIKKVLAEQPWTSNSKFQAVIAYDNFAEMAGIQWSPPNYHRVKSLPFVPTETEVNQLIAGVGKKLATFLQLLKETGARFSEL